MEHFTADWQDADGTRIFAQGWHGPNPPKGVICLVHGLGEHSGRYEHVARKLVAADMALVAFDLRGHGKSEGARGHVPSYEFFLEEISRLLSYSRERWPDVPLVLYGHSLGGAMVLYYALERQDPITAVIATAPALRPAFDPPAWKLKLGRILNAVLPSLAMGNGLNPKYLSRDPKVVEAYLADPLVHDRISVRLFNEWTQAVTSTFARSNSFRVPILLMHGKGDRITSMPATKSLADKIGSACTLKLWDDVYHEPHNEPNQDEILDYLIRWIRERLAT